MLLLLLLLLLYSSIVVVRYLYLYYFCTTMSRNTVTRSYKIPEETAETIDRLANEHNEYKSKIIELAVQEFDNGGANARLETKMDELLAIARSEGTPSEQSASKEKNGSGSSSPIPRRTEEMYSTLLSRVNEDGRDKISQQDLEQAIGSVVSKSDYALDRYVPRLKDRLTADGWDHIEHTGWFTRTDKATEEVLEEYFPDDMHALTQPTQTPTKRLEAAVRRISDNQGRLFGVLNQEPEPVITGLGNANEVLEQRAQSE